MPNNTYTEEHSVTGEKLISKIKELIHEGNVRHIIVKNDRGEGLIEIPLAVGVVGVLLLPVWAALGTIAALAADLRIVVVREDLPKPPPPPPDAQQ
ncbi:MAG: hypothetical protein QOJ65_637 [Fimbriimonadaceae bacterium]|jgi:hypothetical protein|nr:hypothetical protein [Fimbriimonadaceae bacterium]